VAESGQSHRSATIGSTRDARRAGTNVPHVSFALFDAAEGAQRGIARITFAHAPRHELTRAFVEMETQFVAELRLDPAGAEERANAETDHVQEATESHLTRSEVRSSDRFSSRGARES
jgi:hypothetical protein